MAQDVVTLWNLALSAALAKGQVSSVGEASPEAELCRLWYDLVRQTVLKSAAWPCAIKHARLAKLAERTSDDWEIDTVAPGYKYAYAAPSDMLAPRYLAGYTQFSRSYINGKVVINTNTSTPILTYTFDQEATNFWDADLFNAVRAALAAAIALKLSGKVGISDRLVQQANELIDVARTNEANEQAVMYERIPRAVMAAGYDYPSTPTGYVLPYENLSGILP